ncbi:methyltransferase [Bailinhaonella thermotolerans]|uniref:Methyltransferase n=1 Tax=Bailinhaonella thermotolerans TaxID=1070861 RepID=A0A3A4B400_9ACTN|nr:methyltransferase [Bailinhaonella thermotolerans]RJL35891.1 methyltransferase [Bailinhaonella thermotolerans]
MGDPAARLRELAVSAGYAAALRAAAVLRIADAFTETATAEELAAAVGARPDTVDRLMTALTHHRVFERRADGRFAHTACSRLLREDEPGGLRYMTLWATEPWTWRMWAVLDESVRSGASVSGGLFGKDFFRYVHEDAPESAEVFARAMTQGSARTAAAIAGELDLTGARSVADIGGGQGHVLATLLERHPGLRGILFDLPAVVADADERLRPGGALAGRAALVGGDCLSSIPVRADVYLLKNLLEWDDDRTAATLRNLAAAAPPGARVVIVQNLVDDAPEPKYHTAMDLMLLLNVGGRRHTRPGLTRLAETAGLPVTRAHPIPGTHLTALECRVRPASG